MLLGSVTAIFFVGCVWGRQGTKPFPSFMDYGGTTVLGNSNNIAYWPLSQAADEMADTDPAHDRKGGNNGKYIDPTTAPAFYPWPPFANPPSAAGQGTLMLGQPGIVTGDFGAPSSLTSATCIVVDGAFVAVPFNLAINPTESFTLEAWVQVGWTTNDPFTFRAVVDCRNDNPGQGFALYAAPDIGVSGNYHWQAIIGNGGSDPTSFTTVTSNDPIVVTAEAQAIPIYLAVTFDAGSQMLLLFVNGQEAGKTIPATYVFNASQPLWIGAGAPFIPQRGSQPPPPPGTPASPLFPWVGAIQDVAIYNVALDSGVIVTHFDNGMGNNP
jgi:hypothetical protein